jgi:hypothetical protein
MPAVTQAGLQNRTRYTDIKIRFRSALCNVLLSKLDMAIVDAATSVPLPRLAPPRTLSLCKGV